MSGSEPAIQYAFDADVTSSNIYSDALRLESTTYPNSRVLYRDYGGSGNSSSLNDRLGRLQRLRETNSSGTIHTEYQFNGTSRMVLTDYKQPNVRLDYIQGSSPYQGLDRFGRVTKHLWAGYSGTPPTTDRVNYTYDYAGNRLTRDVVGTTTHDQTYTYDGLHRLQSNNESGTAKDRYWQLDQLGNWDTLRKGLSPSSTLLESRSHNDANELTGFGTPSAAAIPDHDRAGNMTELVQPYKLADTSLALKYDAWNRLVEVESYYGTTLALNEYDGLNRRIVRDETGGSGVLTHFFYNQQWQVLEEHVGTSTTANKQFVYHPHYVDAIALRRDASGNDHYYLQDANFNVTAVTDNTGTVKERYAYTPYGEVTVLDADFSADSDNKSDISNEHLYTGRRLDPETGLQLNRNRFYAAGLGRWVNRDPIGYFAGYNLYRYVDSNPAKYLDPEGLSWEELDWKPPKRNPPLPEIPPSDKNCCKYKDGGDDALYKICMKTPDDPWSNCVRDCLQNRYDPQKGKYKGWFGISDHLTCFLICRY